MSVWQRLEELSWHSIPAIVAGIAAGLLWLIRLSLTNRAEIELLKADRDRTEKRRSEDQHSAELQRSEVQKSLSEVRSDVKEILQLLASRSK